MFSRLSDDEVGGIIEAYLRSKKNIIYTFILLAVIFFLGKYYYENSLEIKYKDANKLLFNIYQEIISDSYNNENKDIIEKDPEISDFAWLNLKNNYDGFEQKTFAAMFMAQKEIDAGNNTVAAQLYEEALANTNIEALEQHCLRQLLKISLHINDIEKTKTLLSQLTINDVQFYILSGDLDCKMNNWQEAYNNYYQAYKLVPNDYNSIKLVLSDKIFSVQNKIDTGGFAND